MFCRNCGTKLKEGAKFCTECGTAVLPPFSSEEIPAEVPVEAPIPEAPAEETSAAPEAPQMSAAEESAPAPDAEEVSLPEEPAAGPEAQPSVSADIPFAPPPYEPPVPAKKKSKKGLIIGIAVALVAVIAVAGVFLWMNNRAEKYDTAWTALMDGNYDLALELFTELGNYEDSAEQAAYLQEMEDSYQQALDDLEAQKFQKAYDAFWDLLDYKESEEYADYHVPFAAASYVKECADNGQLPNEEMAAAMELDVNGDISLNQLIMYEFAGDEFYYLDSDEAMVLAEECYLNCALMNLELGDFGMADYFGSYLTDRYSEYEEAYLYYCADQAVLDDLRECVDFFYYGSYTGEEYVAFVTEMIDRLTAYEGQHFSNWELQYLAYDYASALSSELDSWNGGNVTTDWNYYTACAAQSAVIEELINTVNFLEDDPELQEVYIGESAYYEACAEVADHMYMDVNGQSLQEDDNGYYVTYTNGTDYTVTMTYNFTFQNEAEEYLAASEPNKVEVAPGETVNLYMNVPEEIIPDWYYWIFNRDFSISYS